MSNILDVWLLGTKIGVLEQDHGRMRFTYDADYGAKPDAVALSVSMPLPSTFPLELPVSFSGWAYEDNIARPFFAGLLPDDLVRLRLAKLLGVSEKNSFGLLEAIGGECAGAVTILPEGHKPEQEDAGDIITLDDEGVFEMLSTLRHRPLLAGENNVRLSLAGAQDKVAVRMGEDGEIFLMRGGAPTTHIIKPLINGAHDIVDSVHNELFCLKLAAAVDLPTAQASIGYAKDEPYLCVKRYDRTMQDDKVLRIHQEDFCQALSVPPEHKYENEGGPTIEQSTSVLQNHSIRPAQDRMVFMRLVIFNFMIGNADAHGKNFSLLYEGGKPSLAPAYDLFSTAIYPNLASKMAMKIGGKYNPNHVYLRHWTKLVPDTALAQKALKKELDLLCDNVREKALEIKSELEGKDIKSEIYDQIIAVIKKRCDQIQM